MFNNLMDFKYKRNGLQALGFYIVFFIIGVLLGGVVSGLIQFNSSADFQTQLNLGIKIGAYVALVYFTLLAFTIIIVKKIYKSALAIILFLLTIIGTMLIGGSLGCIFPAILSTFEAKD